MRELKYAILGLVNQEPITGYDITKKFRENLSKFWDAKHSQIYPELRKLVDEKLIEFEILIQGERLKKKLYTITDDGRRELFEWLEMDEELGPVPKEPFRLRLYFWNEIKKSDVARLLDSQIEKHTALLGQLEERYNGLTGKLKREDPLYGDYMLIKGAIYRERAYIDWLVDCIEMTGCREP